MSGTFHIVPTPIGNLEDITLRALRVLKEVDLILCEDKRTSIKLLSHYDIKSKLKPYHKFNEKKEIEEIISLLHDGKNIAIISDAGTPVISDPGSEIINRLRNENIDIESLPGASALTCALSAFGISREFLFLGFLPESLSERKKIIEKLCTLRTIGLAYVAPHDLKKYISEIYESEKNYEEKIKVYMGRELTKKFEEIWTGSLKEFREHLTKKEKIKGEIVLAIDFSDIEINIEINPEELLKEMNEFIEKGNSKKDTAKIFSKKYNIPKNTLYDLLLKD